MKTFILILILSLNIFTQDSIFSKRKIELRDWDNELINIKEKEFGMGDVWGKIFTYSNKDSSKIKIIKKRDAGDYGSGVETFYILKNDLIFKIDLVISTIFSTSINESNKLEITETLINIDGNNEGTRSIKQFIKSDGQFIENDLITLSNTKATYKLLNKSEIREIKEKLQDIINN